MKFDLHLHTTASDGKYTPAQLVEWCAKLGLKAIAITDHDSVGGVAPALEAARAYPDLRIIPGVEISTDVAHGEVHILGYFVDYRAETFTSRLEHLRLSRVQRGQKMVAKLEALGMPLSWERVLQIAGWGSIGRPHIAEAMLERGYVPSVREAFVKYISREGPAYVEREKMTPTEAVEFLRESNGLPVLAHPGEIDEKLLNELVAAGLAGIEVYYNGYTPEIRQRLKTLAKRHKLATTGGSDFHGVEGLGEAIPGSVEVPAKALDQLLFIAGERATLLTRP
jgi:predicted metal-dependent phosphoesterase TrpH